jgi:serine/threonine-protein kinase
VRARAYGREEGLSWYAMDLLPGGDLQDLLKVRGALPPPIALALSFQVLLGLDALHRAGLVHRDVKLTNVLLDARSRAVVTDLGVARHPRHLVQFQTETGQEMGTEGYTAPEQWEHAASVGPPADVFATGVLLYRLLTRKPPHRLHLAQIRPELLSDQPEALRPVLLEATRIEPAARFQDARAMGAAIAAAYPLESASSWIRLFDDPEEHDPWEPVRAWLARTE